MSTPDVDLDADAAALARVEREAGALLGLDLAADSSRATADRVTGSAASSRAWSASGRRSAFIIPMGDYQGYINLKGYKEFDNAHRPDGWNVWLTFNMSPAEHSPPARPMHTK
jgi:hypothetical protein